MAKAWRNEAAAKINARRAACRHAHEQEPTARVQKNMRQAQPSVPGGANFLLVGLLQRAGLWYPHHEEVAAKPGILQRAWHTIRDMFS
jgi:hypothetical protein